jgi:hypothetical protein
VVVVAFALTLTAGCDDQTATPRQATPPSPAETTPPTTDGNSVASSLSPRDSRFALLTLPLGVQIDVPKNWRTLDGDINTNIETFGEAVMNLAGIEIPPGQKVNLFRANSNPPTTYAGIAINATDSDIAPTELLAASDAEIHELTSTMQQMFEQAFSTQNLQIIRFDPVRREIIDGHPSLIINYVRSGPQGPVIVQMTRLFLGEKEISLNLSYRQSETRLRPKSSTPHEAAVDARNRYQ